MIEDVHGAIAARTPGAGACQDDASRAACTRASAASGALLGAGVGGAIRAAGGGAGGDRVAARAPGASAR